MEMKQSFCLFLGILCLAVLASIPTSAGTTAWDLAEDFTLASNPNGEWEYGQVLLDGLGNPSLRLFTTIQNDIYPGHFGPGQSGWGINLFKSPAGAILMDLPAGRVGGHSGGDGTGCRWTAPRDMVVNITGGAWKMWPAEPVFISVWVKGTRLINEYMLPTWSTVYNSGNPWTFAQMMTEQGGDPAVLQNVSFAAGEQIYFRVGPNDWTGLDLTITEVPEPATLGALSVGLVGLLGLIRRRR